MYIFIVWKATNKIPLAKMITSSIIIAVLCVYFLLACVFWYVLGSPVSRDGWPLAN